MKRDCSQGGANAPGVRWSVMLLVLAASVTLAGCAGQKRKTLYQWESYQPQVYQYFVGESKEAQIAALERDIQVISAAGNTPPPGFHAHLGLLYGGIGKDDQMVAELQKEKAQFPESAPYIDFLLKSPAKKSEAPK